jgi:hypothetical protein
MKKIATALVVAATVGVAAIATSGSADARPWGHYYGGWRGPGPWIGGLAAGAIIGGALAARPYYYPYGYYGPYPYAYGPGCPLRTWWNGYRWVRTCY